MTALVGSLGRRLTESEIWFSYQGRISAGQYWGRFIPSYLAGFAIGLVIVAFVPERFQDIFMGFLYLFGFWPGTALAVKRLHDTGRSGAYLLIVVIPLVGIIVWLILSLQRGADSPNRYGPATGYRYPGAGIPAKVLRGQHRSDLARTTTNTRYLLRLALDESRTVRKVVAENATTPPEALDLLATDDDPLVREAVATNPSTASATLQRLASDPDNRVKSATHQRRLRDSRQVSPVGNDSSLTAQERSSARTHASEIVDQLDRLDDLVSSGRVSEEEFGALKRGLLRDLED